MKWGIVSGSCRVEALEKDKREMADSLATCQITAADDAAHKQNILDLLESEIAETAEKISSVWEQMRTVTVGIVHISQHPYIALSCVVRLCI
jgi:hypothetical protein